MKRKKPIGDELRKFCEIWDASDHEGKVRLSRQYELSYDSAKHVRSDNSLEYPLPRREKDSPRMRVTVDELLGMRPAVNLDFCTFDLETSNLEADFSVLLTAVIKPFGCEPMVFRFDTYPEWEKHRANDKGIVKDVSDELRKHAIIISHFGTYFDIPYLRAKILRHGLEPLPQMFAIDSWHIAKKNFKVSSRRLKNLSEYFQVGEKEPVEPGLWLEAAYNGDRAAMDRIVAHNVRDCEVLEKLACLTFPLIKSIGKL